MQHVFYLYFQPLLIRDFREKLRVFLSLEALLSLQPFAVGGASLCRQPLTQISSAAPPLQRILYTFRLIWPAAEGLATPQSPGKTSATLFWKRGNVIQ